MLALSLCVNLSCNVNFLYTHKPHQTKPHKHHSKSLSAKSTNNFAKKTPENLNTKTLKNIKFNLKEIKLSASKITTMNLHDGIFDLDFISNNQLLLSAKNVLFIYDLLSEKLQIVSKKFADDIHKKNITAGNPMQLLGIKSNLNARNNYNLIKLNSNSYFLKRLDEFFIFNTSPKLEIFKLNFLARDFITAGIFTDIPIVMTRDALWLIDKETSESLLGVVMIETNNLLKNKSSSHSQTLRGLIANDNIWLYSSKNVWLLNNKNNKTSFKQFSIPALKYKKILSDQKNTTSYNSHNFQNKHNNLHKLTFDKVLDNLRKIESLTYNHHIQKLVLKTPFSLIIIADDGSIEQTVPVSSHRKLIDYYLTENIHLYLFDDHQIEIYHPTNKTVYYSNLGFEASSTIKKILISQKLDYLALIENARLRIYHNQIDFMQKKPELISTKSRKSNNF